MLGIESLPGRIYCPPPASADGSGGVGWLGERDSIQEIVGKGIGELGVRGRCEVRRPVGGVRRRMVPNKTMGIGLGRQD